MTKFTFLLINIFGILFFGILQQSNVSIQMDAPVVVDAGQEFRVKVTIDKGDLEGFARFQQILPAGITAEPENSSIADFSFKAKRIRLIWLRLPNDNQITVVYRLKTDERLKGDFQIGGRFSYIENNERKSARIIPQKITIIPSPNIPPDETIDINDFEKATIPEFATPGNESITCIRQTPYTNASGEIVVNLLVNKLDKEKFAKIEEQIPTGYTAVDITTKDAIFTFKDQMAKFLWMNLPLQKYFVVTYNLIPSAGNTVNNLSLNGKFSYIEGDKTMIVDIVEKDVNLVNVSDEDLLGILSGHTANEPKDITPDINTNETETKVSGNNTETVNENTQPDTPSEKDKQTETVKSEPDTKTPDENNTDEQKKEEDKPTETEQITEPISKKENKPKTRNKNILQPEDGVYYRVQVAAGHKPVDIDRYFKRLRLNADVKSEQHDGWLKYSVGSFGIYKDARDYRIHVWNTTEINDAFVAAYNNGGRITVQEALMIANQKWYK